MTDSVLKVTVAVPTYLRPAELTRTLKVLTEQSLVLDRGSHETCAVDVLVIDNDPLGSAASVVESLARDLVRYEHEPRPGLTAVRNRALDECAESDLLLFIDDDEVPQANWLGAMVDTWRTTKAAAVSGRVVCAFDGEIDPWIAAGGFFDRRSMSTGTSVSMAATNNLLLDLPQVRALGLRFDEYFGLTGGEDGLFTRQLVARGGRMVWCNESIVTDHVPAARTTRRWVLKRAWSHGNSTSLIDLRLARRPSQRVLTRGRLMVRGTASVLLGGSRFSYGVAVSSTRHRARGLRRLYRGAGILTGVSGLVYQEYGRGDLTRRIRRHTGLDAESRKSEVPPRTHELVVLQSFPVPKPTTNPYLVMLANSLVAVPGVEVRNFSWRAALFSHYDVFHVHWPEILVGGSSAPKRVVKQALFVAFLLRLRVSHIPLVRTIHNLDLPSSITAPERVLLRWAERWTTLYIRLNFITQVRADKPIVTIPHGHYREWFADLDPSEIVAGRVAYVGLIRRYKGVEQLIAAFKKIPSSEEEVNLHIAGQPTSASLRQEIGRLVAGDERIGLQLRFLSDQELVAEITEAELVILPYRFMHNSGGALAALSLGRPVLVPDNEVNRQLGKECGPVWVQRYVGELTGADVRRALDAVRSLSDADAPRLEGRHWGDAGLAHVAAYRRAIEILAKG